MNAWNVHGINYRSLFFVFAMLNLAAFSAVRAEGFFHSPADTTIRGTLEYRQKEHKEGLAVYEYFVDEGMSEAYTHCYGLMFHWVTQSFSSFTPLEGGGATNSRSVIRGETGLIFAAGEPLQYGSDWVVDHSSLGMVAAPLSITFLYNLSRDGAEYFEPYFGMGFGGIFGFERISAKISRNMEVFEWHDTCYRHSFEGHVLLGANKKISDRIRMVFELRWTQAGKGRLKRGEPSEEELDEGWGEVFQDFQQPDFNFTGVSASMGFRW